MLPKACMRQIRPEGRPSRDTEEQRRRQVCLQPGRIIFKVSNHLAISTEQEIADCQQDQASHIDLKLVEDGNISMFSHLEYIKLIALSGDSSAFETNAVDYIHHISQLRPLLTNSAHER